MGTLVTILIAVIVVAVFVWLLGLIPMEARAKQILQIVCAVALVIFLVALLLGGVPVLVIRD